MAHENNMPYTGSSRVSIALIGLVLLLSTLILSGCDQPAVGNNRVKIAIDEEGIYRLTADELLSVGMDIRAINPAHLRLSLRGVPQSLFVFDTQGSLWLEFYGVKSDSLYTAQNIYMLDSMGGENKYTHLVDPDILTASSSELGGTTIINDIIRREENLLYYPQVEGENHWFWISASSSQVYEFPVELSEIVSGDGSIRLSLWSITEAPQSPDHHLLLRINGHTILDSSWDGKGEQQLQAVIPSGVLRLGENIIVIEIPGDTQASVEIDWIDWFEISYPRRAVAQNGCLKFSADESQYSLQGFHNTVHVYEVAEDGIVALKRIGVDNQIVFQSTRGRTYYAVEEACIRSPLTISSPVLFPDLGAAGNGADYIVIGPESLIASAGELLSLRESQGLRVMSMPLSAIYDQYNYGFPEPEAVRSYLIDAVSKWSTAPRYLLLLGDASYDPWNYLELPIRNILPTYFVQTQFGGQTASDLPYSDLDGDRMPDIAVGRIPALTEEEVAAFVRKTIAYEAQNSKSETISRILAIADGQEEGFRIDAQKFLDIFMGYSVSELYAPDRGISDANLTIMNYFNEGYSFISYFGHGSVIMWGKDRLFSVTDAQNLSNTQYPVVINMTCLTGLFTHPEIDSLGEVLLFNPNGGAVALLAPTSLTLPGDQSLFSTPLGEAIRDGDGQRLGDIYLFVQREMSISTPANRDVLETFLLFGDPGLIIRSR